MGRLTRYGFTILEIVVVLVVIGILAATLFPRLHSDRLQNAAALFIDAIRYTQHLAMTEDKYVPSLHLSTYSDGTQREKDVKQWFKKWWTFYVWDANGTSTSEYGRGPAIVIFSDHPSSNDNNRYNNNPEYSEVARDPISGLLYSGHEFDSSFEGKIESKYNLYKHFGIQRVVIDSPCSLTTKVAFDEVGRPHCQQSTNSANLVPYNRLLKDRIVYTLCSDRECEKNISICLEPMTGLAQVCP